MDILIKNMEMPKNCEDCFACEGCSYESYDYCNILKAMTTRGERRKDCPLVALPEHGDLIDRDKLYKDTEGIGEYCYDPSFVELCDALYDAEVIVEATE